MRYHYLIAACVANTLFRYSPFCFSFGHPDENHTSYAVGQALSYIFLLLSVCREGRTRWQQVCYEVVMWCAISNFMDELFFKPLEFGLNEYIFVLFITVWTIFRTKKTHGQQA